MDHLDPTRHPEPPRFNKPQFNPPQFNPPQFSSPQSSPQPASPPDSPSHPQPNPLAGQRQPDAPPIQHRLIGDLRQVIDNAEDLLNCTDSARDGAYRAARDKLAQALAVANDELQRIEDAQLERMIAATHEASIRNNDHTGEARLFRAFH